MRYYKKIIIFCSIVFSFCQSFAQEGDQVFTVIVKKQEEKKKKRWSLSDWLATKEKIRLMDTWLAMNSSANKFEFFLRSDYGGYDYIGPNSLGGTEILRFHFAAYASIVGLSGSYSDLKKEGSNGWDAQFNLRLMGTSVQSTQLTGFYGFASNRQNSVTFKNQYAGADLSIYILESFGLTGNYRKYFSASATAGAARTGRRWEYGAFIEFGIFRISGLFYDELLESTTQISRKGILGGATLFF